jgi:hypothetical protein
MPAKQRHDDGHRLARIGRQGPADDLLDVVVDRAPLAHRRRDRGEVVVGQHHSAASLAASLPFCPIAIPASARFSAGASFTPSPVIATVSHAPAAP